MRIIYLGTPEFAVAPLSEIIKCSFAEVVAVVCNRDKPMGRKMVLTAPPVKVFADEHNIPVLQYNKIRNEGVEDIRALKPDLMITCAFGQILSRELIDIPKKGVINIHASLLPLYRGASPINYAILNGETETGITIMKTDVGIDTGDIILQLKTSIGKDENACELANKLSLLGAEAIKKALLLIEKGKAIFTPQNEEFASYSKMIKKGDTQIDFNMTAGKVVNFVRAFAPNPATYTYLNGQPFKVYKAEISKDKGKAGAVLKADSELVVGTSDCAVRLLTVQKAGGKVMSDTEFLRGNKLVVGEKLG